MVILWSVPNREKLDFYGDKYSVPLVAYNEKGQVLPYMVRWDFNASGWVIATLPDGPSPSDYPEVNDAVNTWMDPQFHFHVQRG